MDGRLMCSRTNPITEIIEIPPFNISLNVRLREVPCRVLNVKGFNRFRRCVCVVGCESVDCCVTLH